jgi:hypothetical protein
MTRVKMIKLSLMALVSTTMLSSCATIFAGGAPKIFLEGDIDEPITVRTEKEVYENVSLPCIVKVKRHKLDGQRIKIESENYKYKDIILEKSVNGWTFGNIAIGGLIGWSVDLITNCVSRPSQTHYDVRGKKKEAGE